GFVSWADRDVSRCPPLPHASPKSTNLNAGVVDQGVEAEALKVRLDDLHRAKIRLADELLVVGDYIGDSTRAEIAYARSLSKPVRFTHPEVDPDA
ncbi:MAG TPA: hypothetical protein VHY58_00815, partial [Streptosporangiaceae bacterium]|nr:hypothetical protein [Streptosporangiaceae bacterium]